MQEQPTIQMALDREGWWAIKHADGWWLGTEAGVLCYEDQEVAKAVLTIRWQMDGGGPVRYSVKPYPGPTEAGDELKSVKTATQAIIDYESHTPPKRIP